jgi:UDP-N-acetylglucosamine--N-acetylmuramyl-(pentapeptide) pyrophosphoryl-undecaprenol N-acetylglucosamine transferase
VNEGPEAKHQGSGKKTPYTKSPVSSPKIVFTGGGTGGHVIPCLAVIAEVQKAAPRAEIFYIGSKTGPEQALVEAAGIEFHAITTGKLRRYFSLQNLIDAVKVPIGILQALLLLRKIKPAVVFAKGGFVSVPAGVAAGLLGIPLMIHESDATPGLTTRILNKFASQICISFPKSKGQKSLSPAKEILTGNPIRQAGSAARGRKFLGFRNRKPILLVTGGSTGAQFLNELTEAVLTEILRVANLVWITGGKAPKFRRANLRQFDFLGAEYPDTLAVADLVITRAGANSLFELAAAGKPSILIPLPRAGSRGDQIDNGRYFARAGSAVSYEQEHIRPLSFVEDLTEILQNKKKLAQLSKGIAKLATKDAAKKIAKLVLATAKK